MRRPAPHVWLLLFALPGYTSRNGSGALGNAVPTRKVMGNCRAHRGDGAASSSSRCFRGLLPLNVKSTTGGSSIAESRTWLLSCPAAVEGEVQGSLVEKTCGGALKRSCTTRDHPADALRAPPRIVRSHLPGPPRISVEEKQRAGSGILRLRGAGEQSGSADEHGGSELRGSGEAPPFGGKDGGDVHEQTGRDEKLKWKRCGAMGCRTKPIFGEVGVKRGPRFCSAHKAPGHRDVVNRKCERQDCLKTATFVAPGPGGKRRMRYCALHRDPEYVSGRKHYHRRCQAPEGCTIHPIYGSPEEGARFCLSHKHPTHRDLLSTRCGLCAKVASFGLPGTGKALFCASHKFTGMVHLKSKPLPRKKSPAKKPAAPEPPPKKKTWGGARRGAGRPTSKDAKDKSSEPREPPQGKGRVVVGAVLGERRFSLPEPREAPQGKGRVVVGAVLGERRFSLPEPEKRVLLTAQRSTLNAHR